jgi:hypothetical protein
VRRVPSAILVAIRFPTIPRIPARVRVIVLAFPLLLAVLELLGGVRIRSRIADPGDYRAAAEFLRPKIDARVRVVAAPDYVDPLMRAALGDSLTFAQVGPSDLAPFETLYAMSVDGHVPELAPARLPKVEAVFGRVSVLRWDLGASSVTVDLIDHLQDARVELFVGDSVTRCPKVNQRRHTPGGLSRGPMRPSVRFECDRRRPHLYVGETVIEDLDLQPRRAVYQHPPDVGFVRTTFPPLELARSIVLYVGLYYEHERRGEHAPFEVVVRIDGQERGRMVHRDLQGWKRLEIDTADLDGTTGVISVETLAKDAQYRTASWAATLRRTNVHEVKR